MKMNAMKDWGIIILNEDVVAGKVSKEELESADFTLVQPVAGTGYIYQDSTGEYIDVDDQPFWFLPIQQPGLFDAPYEDIQDIKREVASVAPWFDEQWDVEDQLCLINCVFQEV